MSEQTFMKPAALITLGGDPEAVISAALATPAVQAGDLLSGNDGKALVRELHTRMRTPDVPSAARLAAAVIGLTRGDAVRHVPFAEVFRPTTVPEDRLAELERVLVLLTAHCNQHSELTSAAMRLRWWSNFAEMYRLSRADERQLLGFFRINPSLVITSSLTLAEAAFVTAPNSEPTPRKRSFEDLSREDIASGASYALETYARSTKLSAANAGRFTNAFPCSRFRAPVFLAYQLREILDAEADVFRAGYRCERTESGRRIEFEILPPDERFGQALEYGYWRSRVMPAKNGENVRRPGALPLGTLIDAWIKSLNDKLASFDGGPGERHLVMKFPEPLLQAFGQQFVAPDKLFAEEVVEMEMAAMELQWPINRLLDFELRPGLRVFDVLKIHRVLRLIAASRMACLADDKVPTLDYWNSLVAVLTREHLSDTLCAVGIPPAAVWQWLGAFVWSSEQATFLDLQYTPAVEVGDHIAVLLGVAASSNYVRNALVSCKTRPWANNDSEMIETLKSAFDRLSGLRVWPSVEYGAGEAKGEVDCLVLWGATLFAFECKRTLLPCSAFERRTTIDYLQEAADQLSRFQTFWDIAAKREELAARLDCAELRNAELRGCIVMSHRLLSGAQWGAWPIRQIADLLTFVRTGKGELIFDGVKVAIPLREGGACSAAHLEQYLTPDAGHLVPIWRSMQRTDEVIRLKSCVVKIPRYGLNWIQFMCELGVVPADLLASAQRVAHLIAERSRMGRLDDARENELDTKGPKLLDALRVRLAERSSSTG